MFNSLFPFYLFVKNKVEKTKIFLGPKVQLETRIQSISSLKHVWKKQCKYVYAMQKKMPRGWRAYRASRDPTCLLDMIKIRKWVPHPTTNALKKKKKKLKKVSYFSRNWCHAQWAKKKITNHKKEERESKVDPHQWAMARSQSS